MRKVDAVTVASGQVHLPVLAARQGKSQMLPMGRGAHDENHGLLHFRRKAIPTTTCSISGRIVHLQTALRSQWDKCRKNNSLFASSSIRRPTIKPNCQNTSAEQEDPFETFKK